jgi:hypothetical protein
MKRRWIALVAMVAAVSAAAFFAAYAIAANYQTWYCGSASTYCTMTESGSHTASTALRDANYVHCLYSTCHSDVWYEIPGQGTYKLRHSYGAQDNSIGSSDGSYAYAWCSTSAGYGTNTARCHADWHT